MNLGAVLFLARRFDEAIEQLEGTVDLHPRFAEGRMWLGKAYAHAGRYEDALDQVAEMDKRSRESLRGLWPSALANAATGRRSEALAQVERIIATFPEASAVAAVYAALGDTEQAFEWLERGFDQGSPFVGDFLVWPYAGVMRDDPRFIALYEDVGLGEAAERARELALATSSR